MKKNNTKQDILLFLDELENKRNFFDNVTEINKYNIDAIIELIQYTNVKEHGEPIFTRREIRNGIKKYFQEGLSS